MASEAVSTSAVCGRHGPILVQLTRAGVLESEHRVIGAIWSATEGLVGLWGGLP